jgi:hypothetical protein
MAPGLERNKKMNKLESGVLVVLPEKKLIL